MRAIQDLYQCLGCVCCTKEILPLYHLMIKQIRLYHEMNLFFSVLTGEYRVDQLVINSTLESEFYQFF